MQEQPKKIALLIAIQNYPDNVNKKFGMLQGPLNDIDLVEQTLIENLGFPKEEIRVLRDAEATHEAIVREFDEWLIQRAGPETEVLFWFCGHGSRVPDRSGQEEDGLESSFLAYDSRQDGLDGEFDIVDDEFHSLLTALTKKTERITLVTDACHSGSGFRGSIQPGAFRGVEAGQVQWEPSRIESFWPESVELLDDDDESRGELEGKYFHVSACSNSQRAWEIQVPGEDGVQHYGGLSYFLVQALREATPEDTYYTVSRQAAVAVSSYIKNQSVWSEGSPKAQNRQLFGGEIKARPAGFQAHVVDDKKLSIEAGYLHGLVKGATLEVVDADNQVLGQAKVNILLGGVARANWEGEHKAVTRQTPIWVRVAELPEQLSPLPVYTDDPELQKHIKDSSWLVAATEDEFDSYRLIQATGTLSLQTNEGLTIWKGQPEEVEAAAQAELQFRALWDLATVEGSFELNARFVEVSPADLRRFANTTGAADVTPHAARGSAAFAEYEVEVENFTDISGRLAKLEIDNLSRRSVHVTVLVVGENRQVDVMWPQQGERDNVIDKRSTRSIEMLLGMDPDWKLERPMRERYLVIATRRYVDFSPFITETATRGAANELPGILRVALDGSTTRGGGAVPVDPGSWGVKAVDLLVRRR
ncbi:MAG: caspase family protein [Planctomycetota bacterium]|jgi:hypothetical protein